MKLLFIFVVASLASLSSFIVHVATVEWLPAWVGSQMQGIIIQPSWDVRYIAGITSLEYGFATVSLYYLAREKLLSVGILKASLIFSILLAAMHGAFFRQPLMDSMLMDYVVGNPLHVVLVQNGFKWLVWLLMSFVVIFGYELVVNKSSANKSIQPTADASAD